MRGRFESSADLFGPNLLGKWSSCISTEPPMYELNSDTNLWMLQDVMCVNVANLQPKDENERHQMKSVDLDTDYWMIGPQHMHAVMWDFHIGEKQQFHSINSKMSNKTK